MNGRVQASATIEHWMTAELIDLPQFVRSLNRYRHWVGPRLRQRQAELGSRANREQRFRLLIAQHVIERNQQASLVQSLTQFTPDELQLFCRVLSDQRQAFLELVWAQQADVERSSGVRLRAAAVMAQWAPNDPRFTLQTAEIASWMVNEGPERAHLWARLLWPIRNHLIDPIESLYQASELASQRQAAAVIGADYLVDDPDRLVRWIAGADADQLRLITSKVRSDDTLLTERLTAAMLFPQSPTSTQPIAPAQNVRPANLAIALLLLNRGDAVWTWLGKLDSPDARSQIILRLGNASIPTSHLLDRLPGEHLAPTRQAILLALGQYPVAQLDSRERDRIRQIAIQYFREDPDGGVHAAADWLLRRLGYEAEREAILDLLKRSDATPKTDWFHDLEGFTFTRVPARWSQTQAPSGKRSQTEVEPSQTSSPADDFWISTHEVTVAQFLRFQPDARYDIALAPLPNCPMHYVNTQDAMGYCNWLSKQHQLDIYYIEKNNQLFPPDPSLRSNGYRLPTAREWELAARAGTKTDWFFGDDPNLISYHDWTAVNSLGMSHPVGQFLPNAFGLFDVLGNVGELCSSSEVDHSDQPELDTSSKFAWEAGGRFNLVRSPPVSSRKKMFRTQRQHWTGFRIARFPTAAVISQK